MLLVSFYQKYIFYFMLLLFTALAVALVLAARDSWKRFRKIKKLMWLALILVLAFTLVMRMFLFFPVHFSYIDEDWYMEAGKNMAQQGEPLLCEYAAKGDLECRLYPKMIAWPSMISVLFLLFGTNSTVALDSSFVFGVLSSALMFMLVYLMFRNSRIAILSSIMLAVNPLFSFYSRTAETIAVPVFFLLLTLLLFMLYIETRKMSVLVAASLSLIVSLFMRGEYLLLLVLVPAMFLIFDKDIRSGWKHAWGLVIPGSLLLLSAVFLIPQLLLLKNLQDEIYSGAYFGIGIMAENAGSALHLLSWGFNIALIAVLVLAAISFRAETKNRKGIQFWGAWLVVFLLFYITFIKMHERMLIIPMLSLMVFASAGLDWLYSRFSRHSRTAVIAGILLLLVIINYPGIDYYSGIPMASYVLETKVPKMLEKTMPPGCYVVTDYPTVLASTTNIKAVSTSAFLGESTPVQGCVLFYWDRFCLDDPMIFTNGGRELCHRMLDEHVLVKTMTFQEDGYEFYLYNVTDNRRI